MNLYCAVGSPPCRAVLSVIKALGLNVNNKMVDLVKKENLKPEFRKINPLCTVPFLDDNGYIIGESHVIMTYLVDKYAKNDSLYPKDVQKRATVDQRLHFNVGTLYNRFSNYYYTMAVAGVNPNPDMFEIIEDAFKTLDNCLVNSKFVAGDTLTVADLAIAVSVSCYECVDFDLTPYKNVQRWYENVKATAVGYAETEIYGIIFKEWIQNAMKKFKKTFTK